MIKIAVLYNVIHIHLLTLESLDYNELGTIKPPQPDQKIVEYIVIAVIDDNVLEMDQETFTLQLQTEQEGVHIDPNCSETVVTIHDDDST